MSHMSVGTAALATKHGKERTIGPILESELGLVVELAAVDTDAFGTFTGEVARRADQRATARAKARAALDAHPAARFGIASEGSFGPHPQLPFVAGGLEMVMLVERESGHEVVGVDLTAETNFAAREVKSVEEALAFAREASFPSHGLVVMAAQHGRRAPTVDLIKGVVERSTLTRAVAEVLAANGSAWVETDMRAHRNPTRMESIERATRALVLAFRSACPRCALPGYVAVGYAEGWPCEECGLATPLPRAEVLACAGCGRREERALPPSPSPASFHCPRCNP